MRAPLLALLPLAGCSFFPSAADWSAQVQPSGDCYEANFSDGVVRGDTSEFHALFACLNHQGTLDAMGRLDTALDAPSRDGTVVTDLYDLATGAGDEAGLFSISGMLDAALALFDDRESLGGYVELLLEVAYAAPVDQLGTAVSVNSSTSLANGVLVPLMATVSTVASAILDSDSEALEVIASALDHADAPRWIWTLALAADAPDSALSSLATDWPSLLADTLALTSDTTNDRNPGPSGDSLRDLISAALTEDALVAIGAGIAPLLEDEYTTDQIADWVVDEDHAGRLAHLDEGMSYLIAVSSAGNTLQTGEDSALVSLIRLLHDGNQSVDCSVDLGITSIDFSLGNLSVSLLQQLALIDPDSAASGVDLLGDALGYPLTTGIMDAVADSGVCPVIDQQLVNDLESLDRLSDPATDDLLRSLLGFLQASDEHIPEIVDLASALHEHQLMEPTEELIRDLAGEDLADTLVAALPALVRPSGRQAEGEFPSTVRPVDMTALCTLMLGLTDAENAERLSPILTTVTAQSSTWTALNNARALLLAGDTKTSHALGLLSDFVKDNPELSFLSTLSDELRNPAITRPALGLLENQALLGAATNTELANEGMIPWVARLYLGGTFDILLNTLALVRDLLEPADA